MTLVVEATKDKGVMTEMEALAMTMVAVVEDGTTMLVKAVVADGVLTKEVELHPKETGTPMHQRKTLKATEVAGVLIPKLTHRNRPKVVMLGEPVLEIAKRVMVAEVVGAPIEALLFD